VSKAGRQRNGDRIDAVITDASLRALAHNESGASAPVLIELDGPMAARRVDLGRRRDEVGSTPSSVVVIAPAGRPAAAAVRAVAGILGHTPRYLRAAGAFAAEATGAQLAALAATPAVRAISPNRRIGGA
jgi:hypothetical protein